MLIKSIDSKMVEAIDVQRAIRSAIVKKANQLYAADNMRRWNTSKATSKQIQGVWRMAYAELKHLHPNKKWLHDRYIPKWITRLDYCAARGGKPLLMELYEIVKNLGNIPMEHTIIRYVPETTLQQHALVHIDPMDYVL